MILRLLSEEITIYPEANSSLWYQANTGSTVSGARAVRVYNDSGADTLLYRYSVDTSNNVTIIGSTTLANNEVQIFEKNTDEFIIAGANVKATSIAFSVS